jgi:hypothetical protein
VATVSNAAGSNGLATAAALGTTTLSATSGDVTGVATLTVTEAPPSVDDMVAALLAAVTAVGPGSSLVTKMTDVQTYLAVPDIVSACSALDSFKTLVAAQSGKKITVAQADQFTADANAIDAAIPCP